MSLIRFYLDEDAVQHSLIAALRLRGAEVTSAQEAGLVGARDEEQLEWCCRTRRVLYTFNVGDFCALHREFLHSGRHHPGIVVAHQQRYSVGEQMRRLLRLFAAKSAEEMHDRVEFLGAWG